MEKGEFLRAEIKISVWRCLSARANGYTRKLLCLLSFLRVNLRVSQTMLIQNQNLFLIVSYCFCLSGEFAKVFERQV